MPVSIVFDLHRRHATVAHTGAVEGRDLADAVDLLYTSAQWQTGLNVLWDGTGITALVVEPGDVAGLVDAHERHEAVAAGSRNALLAVRADDRLIAELFVTLSRRLTAPYRLFTDRNEALAWLDGGEAAR